MAIDVSEHARFFDHLVELVPARHYYDDEFARMNPRFLAKAAREAQKADLKAKAKEARREKFDPDKAATTLDVQRRKLQGAQGGGAGSTANENGPSTSGRENAAAQKADAAAAAAAAGADAGSAPTAAGLSLQLSGGAVSRQELVERLHKKVEEFRERRKASSETATKAKEWRQNTLRDNAAAKQQQEKQPQPQGKQGKQQQQQQAGSKRKGGEGEGPANKQQHQQQAKGQQGGNAAKKARREEQQQGQDKGEEADFKFAKIEVEEGRGRGPGGGAKRPPKQVLLKQAEAQRAELQALAGTQEGKAKAQAAVWKAALARASGEKVLDDPKLLRRSLKREGKLKEKHAKAWKERVSVQQEAQAARQSKRTDNLAARRQTKQDNKKAKREKKLLRPGFEGRREGFIAPGAGAAGAK